MKKKLFKKLLLVLLPMVMVISCKDESTSFKDKSANRAVEIKDAQDWYNSQLTLRAQTKLKTVSLSEQKAMLGMEPDWKLAYRRQNKEYRTVEVVMGGKLVNLVPRENLLKSEQTKDVRYQQSMTRLVVRTDKKTKEKIGFTMTIVPTVEYIEATNFKPFHMTYLNRDKNFSGRIIFHDLLGNFISGWEYEKGKITAKIVSSLPNTKLSNLKALNECYRMVTYEITTYECESYAIDEWGGITGTNCTVHYSLDTRWESYTCPDQVPTTEEPPCTDCHTPKYVTLPAGPYPDNFISRIYSTQSTLTSTQYEWLRSSYDQGKDDLDNDAATNCLALSQSLEGCLDCNIKIIFKIDASIPSAIKLDKAHKTISFKDESAVKAYYPFMGDIIKFIYEVENYL